MGLIYVNPEGPNGKPDPLPSAQDMRETLQAHGHERRRDLCPCGRRTHVRQAHGDGPASSVGAEPEGAPIEAQGFGWASTHKSGKGVDTITSGIEGPWTANPTQWDTGYLDLLYKYEWQLAKSPAGAHLWTPSTVPPEDMAPGRRQWPKSPAHDDHRRHGTQNGSHRPRHR
jgi:catalase-peroxidase